MAKSKRRKPKPKPAPGLPAKPPQSHQLKKPLQFLNKILRGIVEHPIVGLVGLLAALLAIGGAVFAVFQLIVFPVLVHPSADSSPDSLALPFNIVANNPLFDIKDASFTCGVYSFAARGAIESRAGHVGVVAHAT